MPSVKKGSVDGKSGDVGKACSQKGFVLGSATGE